MASYSYIYIHLFLQIYVPQELNPAQVAKHGASLILVFIYDGPTSVLHIRDKPVL